MTARDDMTAHDEQTATGRREAADMPETQTAQTRDTDAAQPARQAESTRESAGGGANTTAARADTTATSTATSTATDADAPIGDNTLLFAEEHLSGLRSRWNDVQAAFVDDPKQCVQKADSLVAEVVEELHASFADTRSRLEAQWARGEDASTEDLRVALRRYRDFFQRLLSV
jgi:hypothetical protein